MQSALTTALAAAMGPDRRVAIVQTRMPQSRSFTSSDIVLFAICFVVETPFQVLVAEYGV